jgi:hypothetical protein
MYYFPAPVETRNVAREGAKCSFAFRGTSALLGNPISHLLSLAYLGIGGENTARIDKVWTYRSIFEKSLSTATIGVLSRPNGYLCVNGLRRTTYGLA